MRGSISIADASKENPEGGPPGDRAAGLKWPTETRAYEYPTEKDTFSTCRGTQSREPTKVPVARMAGEELLQT